MNAKPYGAGALISQELLTVNSYCARMVPSDTESPAESRRQKRPEIRSMYQDKDKSGRWIALVALLAAGGVVAIVYWVAGQASALFGAAV